MKVLKLFTLLTLASCGTATLAPQNERVVKFTEPVKADKNTIYTSSLAYLAKNLGDANSAIKMQDKEAGMIISKGISTCNVFRQFGDIADYSIQFNLTVKASDNQLKITFEDLVIIDNTGKQFLYGYNQITDASKVEKAKECLSPIKDSIVSSIN